MVAVSSDPTTEPAGFSTEVEVRYAETDQMGVVHHAVYPVWFELARTRLCAQSGFPYIDIEEMGYALMVTALELRFRRSATYGDTVSIGCRLTRFASRALRFDYEVTREGEPLATGSTDHVWIDRRTGRPCRAPKDLREAFESLADRSDPPAG